MTLKPIVAGIDGSPESTAAVERAAREAGLRGAGLRGAGLRGAGLRIVFAAVLSD